MGRCVWEPGVGGGGVERCGHIGMLLTKTGTRGSGKKGAARRVLWSFFFHNGLREWGELGYEMAQ